jgi:epoxyqueuosine reductase
LHGIIRPLMIEDTLKAWAARKGYDVAWGPGRLLSEVLAEISGIGARGEIAPDFVGKWIGWANNSAAAVPIPESVIAVAVPCPACTIGFTLGDRMLTGTVPPTYVEDARDSESIRQELIRLLPELNGDLVLIGPARKALAARLGLTAYGLNNITYSANRGSYIWIVAFAAAARLGPCGGLERQPQETLAECESCGRCRDACPTGAIAHDRFLLRPEKCLTCWNELPEPLPAWIPQNAHNSLIGCMICQEVCPLNEGHLENRESGVAFDAEETAAMIAGNAGMTPELEKSIQAKLEGISLAGIRSVIGRNFALLSGRGD